jgi:hypothetical protein
VGRRDKLKKTTNLDAGCQSEPEHAFQQEIAGSGDPASSQLAGKSGAGVFRKSDAVDTSGLQAPRFCPAPAQRNRGPACQSKTK